MLTSTGVHGWVEVGFQCSCCRQSILMDDRRLIRASVNLKDDVIMLEVLDAATRGITRYGPFALYESAKVAGVALAANEVLR